MICSTCGYVVEWVRTCFFSDWRLIQGHPEILTRGGYVRRPAGTPHYAGWHNLGSRDWTSDERDVEPALGEYSGARSYSTGFLAVPAPPAGLVGSANCLAEGERFPLPVVPDFHLVAGFDSRCYTVAPDPGPPATPNVQSREFQIQMAVAMDLLSTDPAQAVTFLEGIYGPDAVVTIVDVNGGLLPASIIVKLPTQSIVLVGPTTSNTQLAWQAIYVANPVINVGPFGTSPFWWAASFAVGQRIQTAGVDPDKPITLVGYSYGGAVATTLAARYHIGKPDRIINLLTFGMPRPGNQQLIDSLEGINQVHLVNDNDPVGSLPPQPGELLPVNLGAASWMFSQYLPWQKPRGTVVLFPDGSTQDTQQSTVLYSALFGIVSDAVLGNPFDPGQPHEIKEYLARLLQ